MQEEESMLIMEEVAEPVEEIVEEPAAVPVVVNGTLPSLNPATTERLSCPGCGTSTLDLLYTDHIDPFDVDRSISREGRPKLCRACFENDFCYCGDCRQPVLQQLTTQVPGGDRRICKSCIG